MFSNRSPYIVSAFNSVIWMKYIQKCKHGENQQQILMKLRNFKALCVNLIILFAASLIDVFLFCYDYKIELTLSFLLCKILKIIFKIVNLPN